MPIAIPNGGGGEDLPTTEEAAAYHQAIETPAGDRTAEEQEIIDAFEEAVQRIGNSKTDSGGTGGRQALVAIEVGRLVGQLEKNRKKSIDQWARQAASGGPAARKAQAEMHGADTAVMSAMLFLMFEMRERLNDSPY